MVYTQQQIEEVSVALACEKNVKTHCKLQAISWLAQGKSPDTVAEMSGISVRSLYRFQSKYLKGGLENLQSKNKGGNNRKIPRAKEKQILEQLKDRANTGEFIRSSSLQEEFERAAGKQWSVSEFNKILKRNGWRKVVPRCRHPKKASDEAIEASKKLTLSSKNKNKLSTI